MNDDCDPVTAVNIIPLSKRKFYKFYTPTCVPCKVLSNTLTRNKLPPDIEIVEIDATSDENKELVARWEVTAVPTMVRLSDGNKFTGNIPFSKIMSFLKGE